MPPFSFLKIAFMLVGQYHCLCLVCSMMFVRSEVVIAVLINGPGKKKKLCNASCCLYFRRIGNIDPCL